MDRMAVPLAPGHLETNPRRPRLRSRENFTSRELNCRSETLGKETANPTVSPFPCHPDRGRGILAPGPLASPDLACWGGRPASEWKDLAFPFNSVVPHSSPVLA